MILLIAPKSVAAPLAEALQQGLRTPVEIATTPTEIRSACDKHACFSLVILDENFAIDADKIYRDCGASPMLELNFAITNAPRVVRQARSALYRRAQILTQSRSEATANLQSELNTTLAGLLLESGLALRDATPSQASRLHKIVELASQLRNRLRP